MVRLPLGSQEVGVLLHQVRALLVKTLLAIRVVPEIVHEQRGRAAALDEGGPIVKVRLCPECLERMRSEPGAREVLQAEGPARPN